MQNRLKLQLKPQKRIRDRFKRELAYDENERDRDKNGIMIHRIVTDWFNSSALYLIGGQRVRIWA